MQGLAGGSGLALLDVLATAADPCGAPTAVNDRTAGGADASGAYACGETLVTLTAPDAACASIVGVAPSGPPSGLSPWLRVRKAAGLHPRSSAHPVRTGAPAPRPCA